MTAAATAAPPPKSAPSAVAKRSSFFVGNVDLPAPLKGAQHVGEATLQDVPTAEALSGWLESYGIPIAEWGKGTTKTPDKLWKELKGKEAAIELWRKVDGVVVPVRVTHVLRGKVCSEESREKGVYCLNTWQQYGDGRTRFRNGLLSEKLTTDEMPIEKNLHEVCERAVTEEEMAFVVPSTTVISEATPAPEFDPDYKCPLKVIDEHFVDHSIELEISKSFPGLLTMYHLYTVDIVCTGLPVEDFNTLEYDGGKPKQNLKYIHAWEWKEWSVIRKFLFEGSECKETVIRGRFGAATELKEWLAAKGVETERWGVGVAKHVENLFQEIDRDETSLELWSKQDGISIVVRVLHVMRAKVCTEKSLKNGSFLYNTWQQFPDCRMRQRDVLLTKKVMPSEVQDEQSVANSMTNVGKRAVSDMMATICCPGFRLREGDETPRPGRSDVKVVSVQYEDHNSEVDLSPSYPGLLTMYHFYETQITCEGLPPEDEAFASLQYRKNGEVENAYGWRWIKWPQILDTLHSRIRTTERQAGENEQLVEVQGKSLEACNAASGKVQQALAQVTGTLGAQCPEALRAAATELHEMLLKIQEITAQGSPAPSKSQSAQLPTDVVGALTQKSLLASDKGENQGTNGGSSVPPPPPPPKPVAPASSSPERQRQSTLDTLPEEKELRSTNNAAFTVLLQPQSGSPEKVTEIKLCAGENTFRICLSDDLQTAKMICNGEAVMRGPPSLDESINVMEKTEPAAEESPCHSPWMSDPSQPQPARPQSARSSRAPRSCSPSSPQRTVADCFPPPPSAIYQPLERSVADCWEAPLLSSAPTVERYDHYTYPLRPQTATSSYWAVDERIRQPWSPPQRTQMATEEYNARRRYPRYFRGEAERLRSELERSLQKTYPRPPGSRVSPR